MTNKNRDPKLLKFETVEKRRYHRDLVFLEHPVCQVFRITLYKNGQEVNKFSMSEVTQEEAERKTKERYPDCEVKIEIIV